MPRLCSIDERCDKGGLWLEMWAMHQRTLKLWRHMASSQYRILLALQRKHQRMNLEELFWPGCLVSSRSFGKNHFPHTLKFGASWSLLKFKPSRIHLQLSFKLISSVYCFFKNLFCIIIGTFAIVSRSILESTFDFLKGLQPMIFTVDFISGFIV